MLLIKRCTLNNLLSYMHWLWFKPGFVVAFSVGALQLLRINV